MLAKQGDGKQPADGVEQVRGHGPEQFGVWWVEGPKVAASGDTALAAVTTPGGSPAAQGYPARVQEELQSSGHCLGAPASP